MNWTKYTWSRSGWQLFTAKVWRLSWLCLLMLSPATLSAVEFRFAEIPGLFQQDRQGVYDRVLQQVLPLTGFDIDHQLAPPKRARLEFERSRQGCFSPANKAEYPTEDEIITSIPFNLVKILALTRQDSPVVLSDQGLANKRIGVVRGLRLDQLDEVPGIHLEQGRTNLQLLDLLLKNRVDVVVDYAPDILLALQARPGATEQLHYSTGYRLFEAENAVLCFRSPETQAFLKKLNQSITAMKENGQLREILGSAYLF